MKQVFTSVAGIALVLALTTTSGIAETTSNNNTANLASKAKVYFDSQAKQIQVKSLPASNTYHIVLKSFYTPIDTLADRPSRLTSEISAQKFAALFEGPFKKDPPNAFISASISQDQKRPTYRVEITNANYDSTKGDLSFDAKVLGNNPKPLTYINGANQIELIVDNICTGCEL